MKDVDPILMRFREVEARIMLLEVRLAEQEQLIRTLPIHGPVSAAALNERRVLREAFDTLSERRRTLLSELDASATSVPSGPISPDMA